MMSKNKKTTGNTYLSVGISIGLPLGAVLGLIIFDNLAIGAGIGLVFGIAVGTAIDSNETKKNKKYSRNSTNQDIIFYRSGLSE